MQRKLALLVLCLSMTFVARADEEGDAVVKRVAAVLDSYGSYEVRFIVSVMDVDDIRGSYLVSGDKFSITVDGQTHFSDGVARYEIYDDEKEVVIDRVDPNSNNIFTNPARAFEFAGDSFESSFLGRTDFAGAGQCYGVSLAPASRSYGNMLITLYVSVATDLPVAISYDYDGEVVDIAILKIVARPEIGAEQFVFDSSQYFGYEIIDFR